jgi:hypothetical protein
MLKTILIIVIVLIVALPGAWAGETKCARQSGFESGFSIV